MIPALSQYPDDALLTTREAGEILRKHQKSVVDLCARGKIVSIRLGERSSYRIKVSDLRKFLDERTLPHSAPVTIPRSKRK